MLTLNIEGAEFFDEDRQEFVKIGGGKFYLEHSLLSVSKWESFFEKPFLDKTPKTNEEMMFYIDCMGFPPGENSGITEMVGPAELTAINDYINANYTATTFGEMPEQRGRGEIITSELIYYWMVAYSIPFECESWHLNRLFSLIRICNIKAQEQSGNKPKTSKAEIARRNAELNRKRLQEYNTRG